MTESQKKYIQYLDSECKRRGLAIRSTDEDLLGKGWEETYKNFTLTYTGEVINKMKMALGLPIVMEMKGRKRKWKDLLSQSKSTTANGK